MARAKLAAHGMRTNVLPDHAAHAAHRLATQAGNGWLAPAKPAAHGLKTMVVHADSGLKANTWHANRMASLGPPCMGWAKHSMYGTHGTSRLAVTASHGHALQ